MTPEDALYLSDACIALSEPSNEEVGGYIGLDRDSACEWSIYGLTVQGWLTLQQDLIIIQNYVETLRTQRDFYKQQLMSQYKAVNNVD